MQLPLRKFISYLEQKIAALKLECTNDRLTEPERPSRRIDLDIAERALVHFRKALELESRLSESGNTEVGRGSPGEPRRESGFLAD